MTGGTFEGEELKGTVLPSPGGDWLLLRRDGILQLDVRITLKTADDHLIYMSYRGMRRAGLGDRTAQQGREGHPASTISAPRRGSKRRRRNTVS